MRDMENSFAYRKALAARITEAIGSAGITDAELAQRLNVTKKTVARWQTAGEGGAGSIKSERIMQLAAALDVDPTWLLVGNAMEVAP